MQKEDILRFLKEFKESPRNKFFTQIGLFGSYARDEADVFSDIDVAVKVDKEAMSRYDVWSYFDALSEIKSALLKRFHLKSDVLDLDSGSPLLEQIQEEIVYV